jgi:hypothetical protein
VDVVPESLPLKLQPMLAAALERTETLPSKQQIAVTARNRQRIQDGFTV